MDGSGKTKTKKCGCKQGRAFCFSNGFETSIEISKVLKFVKEMNQPKNDWHLKQPSVANKTNGIRKQTGNKKLSCLFFPCNSST